MAPTQLDPLPTEVWDWSYGLPPVTTRPQIGVFGYITRFDSTSVGGSAVIGSTPRTLPRGEELRFESVRGLGAGTYRFTPLVSSGQETTEASLSGEATVFLGGDLKSHPSWLPFVQISAWVPAIVWILLGIFLSWWFRREERIHSAEPEKGAENS